MFGMILRYFDSEQYVPGIIRECVDTVVVSFMCHMTKTNDSEIAGKRLLPDMSVRMFLEEMNSISRLNKDLLPSV